MDTSTRPCGGSSLIVKDNTVTAGAGSYPVPAPLKVLSPRAEIQAVIDRIAREHNVTAADIVSPKRTRVIVKARDQAILEVSTRWPWLSLPKLGKIFGGRDHTTIMHSLNKSGAPPRNWNLRSYSVDARIHGLVMGRLFASIATALEVER